MCTETVTGGGYRLLKPGETLENATSENLAASSDRRPYSSSATGALDLGLFTCSGTCKLKDYTVKCNKEMALTSKGERC